MGYAYFTPCDGVARELPCAQVNGAALGVGVLEKEEEKGGGEVERMLVHVMV